MKLPTLFENSWKTALNQEFDKMYMQQLQAFLIAEKKAQKVIFPPENEVFRAFDYCSWEQLKVVIIGQDPYHGFGQANGLCFSVRDEVAFPPSLQNIFKEVQQDLGTAIPASGNLERWAKQGVLLLNATLTVEANKAGSHQNKGWELFTDAVIKCISDNRNHVVFLLWGNYAKAKAKLIDERKHRILFAGHPSPLSANRGLWFNHQHFSKTNEYLQLHQLSPIVW